MQEPKRPASSQPKPLTDAEFFGAPVRYVEQVVAEKPNMPDWYYDWLSPSKLKQDFVVWHDAWEAVEIFIRFQYQWLHGFNGITGLNYAPIVDFIDLRHTRRSKRLALRLDINALELGAMTAFNEIRRTAEEKAEKERANK